MFKKSLFRNYFVVCFVTVVASVVILGAVLLGFTSQYFGQESYKQMKKYVNQAVTFTADNYINNEREYLDKRMISYAYSLVSTAINAEVYLTNLNGEIIFYSNAGLSPENQNEGLNGKIVLNSILNTALKNGLYEETGSMHGLFKVSKYTVGMPVVINEIPIGVVFASSPTNDLSGYIKQFLNIFIICVVIILAIASILIYIITSRMMNPLKLMLEATKSFSGGDFSKRIPVEGYDEIGQLAVAFNNMASSLALTENSRRSFVANVSHELKTPMTTIGGFVDGILDGTIPESEQRGYLEIVSNESQRLSRLVRSMLDTARLETGELVLEPTLFDISEIIRQTIFTFERNIDEKEIEIRGLERDKVIVFADEDLIHQVIYNLIDNAVKFTENGGYISFDYETGTKLTCVRIRNSGAGLSKQEMSQLFERFYKSDKSRSLNKTGVGLGLHIVKSIINQHNGEVSVESVEGEYTQFNFSLQNPAPVKNKS